VTVRRHHDMDHRQPPIMCFAAFAPSITMPAGLASAGMSDHGDGVV
jgi:hypothetical protein